MRLLKGVVFFCLGFFLNIECYSQCNYTAGNTCDSAPVICDLNCLDGFKATLFPEANVAQYIPMQPPLLCWDGSTGTGYGSPTNMSWFAFIAGSSFATISITPTSCQKGDGIQVGLFDDCDFSDTDVTSPEFKASEFIACNTATPYPGPVIISTSNLSPGKAYYFFVDGNNGDVCEYTVNVISANQADTLPDINFSGKDTLITCPNSEFDLKAVDFHYDIDYYWKIDPPTVKYPYANWTKLDSLTKWRIAQKGTYTISMFAYNRCDATDTIQKTIVIKDLENEIFDDVTICQNKFPYEGPVNEDKNGDGIGWMGPDILFPGQNTFNVVQANGCRYNQEVNVLQHTLQPAEKKVVVECEPYQMFGINIDQTELGVPITLADADKNGCDSLIILDAYVLNLQGNLISQNCADNKITMGYNIFNVSAPAGYNVIYEWKDGNDNVIPDNDGNVTNILIDKATDLKLSLYLSSNGKTCRFDEATITIDPAQQLPLAPEPANWALEFCEDSPLQTFDLVWQNGIVKYNWVVENGVVINGNPNTQSPSLDFSNVPTGVPTKICVSVENACGKSQEICNSVTKIAKPVIALAAEAVICEGDEIVITAANTNNATINNYSWAHSGGQFISGNTSTNGPITLRYNTAGDFQIGAVANNNHCAGSQVHFLKVLPIVSAPILNYQPYADKILVTWNSVPCAVSYNCYVDGVFTTNTQSIDFLISGLITNKTLNVRIEAVGADCACGMSSSSIDASTLSCTEVDLALISTVGFICQSNWHVDHQFTYNMQGNIGNGTLTWSGSNVDQNGSIKPQSLGAGVHEVFLTYEEFGCKYQDSVSINLIKTPEAVLQTRDPECREDVDGSVMILPANQNEILTYILDGKPMEEGNLSMVSVGSHNIEIIDANSCSVIKTFEINPPTYPDVEIKSSGVPPYYDNENINFQLDDANSELNLIDSVVWLINGEVICSGNCNDVLLENYESGIYDHQIVVYYKNCELRQDFEMQVKQSPKVYTSNVLLANGVSSLNNGFKIVTNDPDLEILSLDIYSRWGENVFSKNSFIPEEGQIIWDGKSNGSFVVPGVYMYKLSYRNERDVIVTEIKDLTVIR